MNKHGYKDVGLVKVCANCKYFIENEYVATCSNPEMKEDEENFEVSPSGNCDLFKENHNYKEKPNVRICATCNYINMDYDCEDGQIYCNYNNPKNKSDVYYIELHGSCNFYERNKSLS